MVQRKIIHVDMDAFYASVEQRDRPELRGRPVVVGGPAEGRGVVAAASYEARAFGVHSAMSAAKAKRLCPDAVFLAPDFAKYSSESQRIREILRRVTELIEPLALDEAYLDITTNALDEPDPRRVAFRIKRWIRDETGLVASAGAGPNKLIAKLASDHEKPDGLVVIAPNAVDRFLARMPVRRLWGVGPKTAERLSSIGVRTVADVRRLSPERLQRAFGKFGPFLWDLAHGRDDRPVEAHRPAKSRGAERTLPRDLRTRAEVEAILEPLAQRVAADLRRGGRPGRTVTLKLRYSDFTTITRSRSHATPIDDAERIAATARALLAETQVGQRPVRLVGIQVSGLVGETEPYQLDLGIVDPV